MKIFLRLCLGFSICLLASCANDSGMIVNENVAFMKESAKVHTEYLDNPLVQFADTSVSPGRIFVDVKVFYQYPFPINSTHEAETFLSLDIENLLTGKVVANYFGSCYSLAKWSNGINVSEFAKKMENIEVPVNARNYRLKLSGSIIKPEHIAYEPINWHFIVIREIYKDGSSSDWFTADELIDENMYLEWGENKYCGLEIVCFNTEEVQNIYIPLLGIDKIWGVIN